MAINKSYAVFGLGRYGRAAAEELVKSGADVLAVDVDKQLVDAAAETIPMCKCADVTDSAVIRQLGISNVDVVIISMASSLESSVMATMLCKEAGVGTIIVKCSSEIHQKVLSKVGADKVVLPEWESGTRLAKNLLSSGFVDIIELSENVSLVEIEVRSEWAGKSLMELNLRKKYSINVVAIRQNGEVCIDIDPQTPLDKTMKLIIMADTHKISKMR